LLFEIPPYPFKFSAESGIMTEPNGLCYIGDSYYDPAVGRFLNEAPLLAVAGINSFAFAGNNPLNPIAAIPAISPALYAGANVYKASKAGDEKDGEDKEGNKGKGEKEKERKGEKPKKWDIVIGERMDRVIKAAKRLGAKFFRGKTRTGNINFVNRAKKRKATIFDIGPDFERRRHRLQRDETPWSDAYNMERKMTKDYDRVIKLWKRTGKFLGESSF
jgi:RHS repeat-associated protein